MDMNCIFNMIDKRKNELFELLSSLIKINSESFGSHGNEEQLAKYIHGVLCELGMDSDIYSPLSIEGFDNHPDYMPGRNLENRYNVTGRWTGRDDKNELMLMAHMDTVQIGDLSNWDEPPLSGEIKDGKICGKTA